MAMAYALDECLVYTEDDGSVRSQKLTTDGLFRYYGVTDCSGAGEPEWPSTMQGGACLSDGGSGAFRIRVVGFTLTGRTEVQGAAKAGPALAGALLALAAAAAA